MSSMFRGSSGSITSFVILCECKEMLDSLREVITSFSQGGNRGSLLLSRYTILENSPKKARTLIGYKSCLYNSIQTQN